jgi:uncharacterized membrane protein YjfL (UPF0719 family)
VTPPDAALPSNAPVIGQLSALRPGFGHDLSHSLGSILCYSLVGAVLIALGFVLVDLITPGKLNSLVRQGKPNAVTIAIGSTLSISLIVVMSILASSGHLGEGLITTASFGLLGMLVQVFAVRILEVVLRIDVGALLRAEEFNPAALAVAAAHVALGLIIAFSVL